MALRILPSAIREILYKADCQVLDPLSYLVFVGVAAYTKSRVLNFLLSYWTDIYLGYVLEISTS